MVYTLSDISHLRLMAELGDKTPEAVIEKLEDNQTHTDITLTESVLALAAELRQLGFNKYANQLEEKLVLFRKTAASLHMYKTHKEDGEALINAAHPDGDVHMADAADQNGDVETILSKHKKIVDVVQKQPTGKLAAYVEQCKIALGISREKVRTLVIQITKDTDAVSKLISGAGGMWGENFGALGAGSPLYQAKNLLTTIKESISSSIMPSVTDVNEALGDIPTLTELLVNPSFPQSLLLGGGVDKNIISRVKEFLSSIELNLKELKSLVSEYYVEQSSGISENKPVKEDSPVKHDISTTTNVQSLLDQIGQYFTAVSASNSPNKATQLKWLEQMNEYVSRNKEQMNQATIDAVLEKLKNVKATIG